MPSTPISSEVLEIQACPACGSADFQATGPSAPGVDCVVDGITFRQTEYSIRECSVCGLLYRTPTLNAEELADYYALVDFRKWEISGFYPTERAVHAYLRLLPLGARILDFGCSSGRLLASLVGDYDCHGLEVNTKAASAAAAKGLKMLPPDSLECSGRTFDVLIMVDVFEHLSASLKVLTKALRVVKHGGVLLIVTGNGDAPACRLDPAQFWYFRNVEHLCMLTRRHALFLERELPVRLDLWKEISHYDTPWSQGLRQNAQHFSYWHFRRGTLLSRSLLPLLPVLNRARHWPVAPSFTCSRDHVLAVFRQSADV
jgi:SAM-dependent methyltransferase